MFDIQQTISTVEQWTDSQAHFTAVDLMEPLPIGGVTSLADHVEFVRADYTDLGSIVRDSVDVTVLQWALFRAEDAEPSCSTVRVGKIARNP